MWGPYGRSPYSRGLAAGGSVAQVLKSTYEMIADLDLVTVIYKYLTMATTYIYGIRRMRKLPTKLVRGQYVYRGKRIILLIKGGIRAIYRYTATMPSSLKTLRRRLRGQVELVGLHISKRIHRALLSTMVFIASRVQIGYVHGWDYEGDFDPGDRIVMDRDAMTVTLNGGNMFHLLDGDLPFFNPGANTLTYSDAEGNRTIKVRVLWRGRWI